MNKVRIFISSTCRDLHDVRRTLEAAITALGHEPVMSDSKTAIPSGYSNVDACRQLVLSADLFLLVIGERYGSESEAGKSITSIEYDTAFEAGIPIYPFVKQSVWDLRAMYDNARMMNVSGAMTDSQFDAFGNALRPAIEDPRVFGFIDQVASARRDAWIRPFADAHVIIEQCKADWSLLFHELLGERRGLPSRVSQGRAPGLGVSWAGLDETEPLIVSPRAEVDIKELVAELTAMRLPPGDVELVRRFKNEIEVYLARPDSPKLTFPKGWGASPVLDFASQVDRILDLATTDPVGLLRRLELRKRCVQPSIMISNDGTAPATDIEVYVSKADGIEFLTDEELASEALWMPCLSKGHQELIELARSMESGNLEARRWPTPYFREPFPSIPPFLPRETGPPAPSIRVRDGDLYLSIPGKLQQTRGIEMELKRKCFLVPDLAVGEQRTLQYECVADETPRPVCGTLRIRALDEECEGK